jgi:hypothetical protein
VDQVELSKKMCLVYQKVRLSRLQIAYCQKIDIEFLCEDLHLDYRESRALEQLWTLLHGIVAPGISISTFFYAIRGPYEIFGLFHDLQQRMWLGTCH